MNGRSTRIALCVGALGGVLLMSPVSAQSPAPTPAPARAPKTTTAPADSAVTNVLEGQVTKVDAKRGWIDVKTTEGRMKLHFPPAALEGVKAGDAVSIEVALTPGGKQ